MKLSELIMSGLVKDSDTITISKPSNGHVRPTCDKGNWFQDHILNYINEEISEYSWKAESGYFVILKSQ